MVSDPVFSISVTKNRMNSADSRIAGDTDIIACRLSNIHLSWLNHVDLLTGSAQQAGLCVIIHRIFNFDRCRFGNRNFRYIHRCRFFCVIAKSKRNLFFQDIHTFSSRDTFQCRLDITKPIQIIFHCFCI